MTRLSKREYYLEILKLVAARSTCIRRAVGCIITDEDGIVLATGYNGPPRNFDHCIEIPCLGATDKPGNTDNCMAVHAEINSLLQCSALDRARIMYCSATPCFGCAKAIANTKIVHVIAVEAYSDTRGLDVLLKAGMTVEVNGKLYGTELDEENHA